MTLGRYRERLVAATNEIDVDHDLKNDRRLFLTWLLTLIALNRDLSAARNFLPSLRERPEATDRPGADLVAWASLAFAALLLDEPWEREAELGIARIQPALDAFGNDARFLEPAIGLSMIVGEKSAASRLRNLRMATPLGDSTEAVGFEALYMSSSHTEAVPLSYLAPGFGRIAAKIHQIPLSITAIAHLGAAYRLAGNSSTTLRSVLTGVVDALDELVYGGAEENPLLRWDAPEFVWAQRGSDAPDCSILIKVSGSGRLHPSAHEVGPASFLLPKIVESLMDQAERPRGARVRTLFGDDGRLEVTLSISESVELREEDLAGFQSRLALAWEHAQRRDPRLHASASLRVEQR